VKLLKDCLKRLCQALLRGDASTQQAGNSCLIMARGGHTSDESLFGPATVEATGAVRASHRRQRVGAAGYGAKGAEAAAGRIQLTARGLLALLFACCMMRVASISAASSLSSLQPAALHRVMCASPRRCAHERGDRGRTEEARHRGSDDVSSPAAGRGEGADDARLIEHSAKST
jgi:hypothetical protein